MTAVYLWACVRLTFRALLLLSVVMISPREHRSTQIQTLWKNGHRDAGQHTGTVLISDLTFTIRSQDRWSRTVKRVPEGLWPSLGASDHTQPKRSNRPFSLSVRWDVRRKPPRAVAQSRCPNQFPQHFLLSPHHQRFKAFIVKKVQGGASCSLGVTMSFEGKHSFLVMSTLAQL